MFDKAELEKHNIRIENCETMVIDLAMRVNALEKFIKLYIESSKTEFILKTDLENMLSNEEICEEE